MLENQVFDEFETKKGNKKAYLKAIVMVISIKRWNRFIRIY